MRDYARPRPVRGAGSAVGSVSNAIRDNLRNGKWKDPRNEAGDDGSKSEKHDHNDNSECLASVDDPIESIKDRAESSAEEKLAARVHAPTKRSSDQGHSARSLSAHSHPKPQLVEKKAKKRKENEDNHPVHQDQSHLPNPTGASDDSAIAAKAALLAAASFNSAPPGLGALAKILSLPPVATPGAAGPAAAVAAPSNLAPTSLSHHHQAAAHQLALAGTLRPSAVSPLLAANNPFLQAAVRQQLSRIHQIQLQQQQQQLQLQLQQQQQKPPGSEASTKTAEVEDVADPHQKEPPKEEEPKERPVPQRKPETMHAKFTDNVVGQVFNLEDFPPELLKGSNFFVTHIEDFGPDED